MRANAGTMGQRRTRRSCVCGAGRPTSGVGPFTDAGGANMAVFRTRAAAEAFASGDPFLLEGVVKDYQIKDWGDQMLS
jgi:uncharacterized protein YciI